ncbi:beta-ketoacyl synthase chain length factor [Paraferrimonas haliotis]|uniref:Beta-ketoacyl synthase-like N-terminal domain-containing protein n=1 Tax=Paraferrimonas haliotis TaxID=2013866 RepID=A0AA37TRP5_9GAMM|nr:beta-ketoacyl synthase chain length factor [Paraferrimonas haliotis]GLS83176.1 hypothetical protein GCM10007894_11530 [Paraferrimonas haliotis]
MKITSNMKLSIGCDAWHLSNDQGLQAIAAGSSAFPELAKVPAGMKRRASALSKNVVASGLSLLQQDDCEFIVFASQSGEIQRTLKLLFQLADEEELSPMAFAQSVVSTAPGLLTIAANKAIPFTTISAAENTFEAALLESLVTLASGRYNNLILMVADEALPPIYHAHSQRSREDNLIVLRLWTQGPWQINVGPNAGNNPFELEAFLKALQTPSSFNSSLFGSELTWRLN